MKPWAMFIFVPLGTACVALMCLSVVGLPWVALCAARAMNDYGVFGEPA